MFLKLSLFSSLRLKFGRVGTLGGSMLSETRFFYFLLLQLGLLLKRNLSFSLDPQKDQQTFLFPIFLWVRTWLLILLSRAAYNTSI